MEITGKVVEEKIGWCKTCKDNTYWHAYEFRLPTTTYQLGAETAEVVDVKYRICSLHWHCCQCGKKSKWFLQTPKFRKKKWWRFWN